MPDVDAAKLPATGSGGQRRRSERVAESLPVIIRGIDLLGQPFEERTATVNFNLHGCRYSSKHHLPKNTWITLESARGAERHNVRARVAWIQRPHSIRELFQIAVELERPANIWGIEAPPTDWFDSRQPPISGPIAEASQAAAEPPLTLASILERLASDSKSEERESSASSLDRAEEHSAEHGRLVAGVSAPSDERLSGQIEQLSRDFERNRMAAEERTQKMESQIAELRESASSSPGRPGSATPDALPAEWRERLQADISIARQQWTELLESSLDSGIERLAGQWAERSQDLQSQMEARFTPNLERVSALLSELAAREMQFEETLRLQRERLRQIAEAGQRDLSLQASANLSELREEAESLRATLEAGAADAAGQFTNQLALISAERAGEAAAKIEGHVTETVARSRTQLEQAAEAAASSFGEVIRGISAAEARQFSDSSRSSLEECSQQLRQAAGRTMAELGSGAASSLERFRADLDLHLAGQFAEARTAFSAELETARNAFRIEREGWQRNFSQGLVLATETTAAKFQGRLGEAAESWLHSATEQLDQQGRGAIELLRRSAEGALRDSCARFFESLAGSLRERPGIFTDGLAGFVPPEGREGPAAAPPVAHS